MMGHALQFKPSKLGGKDLALLRAEAASAGVQPKNFRPTFEASNWAVREMQTVTGPEGEPALVETSEAVFHCATSEADALMEWLDSKGWGGFGRPTRGTRIIR